MINKLLLVTLVLLLSCAACWGQTSFQGITPGTSTHADVDTVLGQPVHAFPGKAEYAPPQGIMSVSVEYDSDSQQALVYEIGLVLLKPVSRSALIQKFNLPQQADACKWKDDFGHLVECFGGQALLVFTYKSGDPDSGVFWIRYCTRGSFSLERAICEKNLLPYGKDDLVYKVTRVKDKIMSTTQIVENVARRGVNFQVTPAVEAELRAAGATPQLIEAIRKNYRPSPGSTRQR